MEASCLSAFPKLQYPKPSYYPMIRNRLLIVPIRKQLIAVKAKQIQNDHIHEGESADDQISPVFLRMRIKKTKSQDQQAAQNILQSTDENFKDDDDDVSEARVQLLKSCFNMIMMMNKKPISLAVGVVIASLIAMVVPVTSTSDHVFANALIKVVKELLQGGSCHVNIDINF